MRANTNTIQNTFYYCQDGRMLNCKNCSKNEMGNVIPRTNIWSATEYCFRSIPFCTGIVLLLYVSLFDGCTWRSCNCNKTQHIWDEMNSIYFIAICRKQLQKYMEDKSEFVCTFNRSECVLCEYVRAILAKINGMIGKLWMMSLQFDRKWERESEKFHLPLGK